MVKLGLPEKFAIGFGIMVIVGMFVMTLSVNVGFFIMIISIMGVGTLGIWNVLFRMGGLKSIETKLNNAKTKKETASISFRIVCIAVGLIMFVMLCVVHLIGIFAGWPM